MNTTPTFISETKLNVLLERVCKPVAFLSTPITSATPLWEGPIKMCQQIEGDLFMVDSVVLEAKRFQNHFRDNSTPQYFHAILCRVYILLYYRHSEDKYYQDYVYPTLKNNMGVYSERTNVINANIDKILMQEKAINEYRKAEDELKKEQKNKPKYCLITLQSGEADEYYSEFNNELLFRNLCTYLEAIKEQYFPKYDIASIWLTAKDVVRKLWKETAPENFIDRLYHKLSKSKSSSYDERGAAEAVLFCVYAMMRTVSKSTHFEDAIKYIESLHSGSNDYDLLYNEIDSIKRLMDEGTISFDDFDYVSEEGIENDFNQLNNEIEAYIRATIDNYEEKLNQRDKELEEKEKKIETLMSQLKEMPENQKRKDNEDDDNEESTPLKLYINVCYELFIRLLENAGVDINVTGNKTRVGDLWQSMTGKSAGDCRKYCSNRNYVNKYTKEKIIELNTLLTKLNLSTIQL